MKHQRKSFDPSGVQFAWDSTSLTLASECLRKYYYAMVLNLVPAGPPNVHLLFGAAYAKALERFFKYRAEGREKEEALRAVIHETLIDTYKYRREVLKNEDGVELVKVTPVGPFPFTDNAKTRSALIRSIVWYVDQFGEETEDGIQTHHLADGRAAIELSFAVELDNDIIYTGHLDRVVRYAGGLFWMDQKTTKSGLTSYYFSSFFLSNQFKGYTWAGQMLLHSPVKGGIIDAACIQVGATHFQRQPVTYSDAHLEEWREQAIFHIRQAQEATRLQRFPQNLTACGNYQGCPYAELCKRSPTVRERFLHGDYVERAEPWDPLESR